jgi:hypothetical protein
MSEDILEFTVCGSPRLISRAIEEYAAGQGSLNAIVVPWESDDVTLSMAVTSAKVDGWAIEHTNLGTVRLTNVGTDSTRVAFSPSELDHAEKGCGLYLEPAEKKRLIALFDGFAHQVQSRLQTAP